MLRVLFYLVIVAALGFGFAWLADRPGELDVTFAGNHYNVPLITAVAGIVTIVAVILILWWLVKSIIQSPYTLRRHFRARKRDRGYQSLSTGLIAAGAGDAEAARRMTKQAGQLLSSDQEPLIKLLEAQTAMLEGRTEDARKGFEAMVDDPETRLLGLRGLYIEAQRVGARDAARHYAAEAAAQAPQLEWASSALMGQLCAEGDWDAALKLVDARKQALSHSKDVVKKERAALLTAKAMAVVDVDHAQARTLALEANKLAPDLVPAAVVAARALFSDGDIRKGSKILEAAWKRFPHPDIASTYVYARSGDTAQDRLKRAKHLVSLRSNNAEGSLALARAAYEAGDYRLARDNAQQVLRASPRESAYLLLADIEEAETGDQGKVREWLARALKAPRDPAWTADGFVSEQWSPVSPVTGRLNSFEWKVPVVELAPIIEAEKPEIKGPVETKPVNQIVLAEPGEKADVTAAAVRAENKPVVRDVEEAVVIMPAAEPVKAPSMPPAPKLDEMKPPVPVDVTGATDSDDGQHQAHIVVDDPGVEEGQTAQKAQSGLRLF
ncbi:heme biosynthesis protein HemY [Brucella intermedia]|uniref:heme biosynthesis protein HemY n=1 Tax=Brucella intermedia TaxID=94625 RepID=UPI000C28BC85|nr:heme biosynthesis protein HemY [Brucella intermedia]PJR90966.1 heme biosynthesis protein HemY [Ochrobactrum sp. 721/2009]PJT17146.1 heme biosynthesis protein HemY [Ochrobactrum sp. 720/2009]PJT25569.1 heme biosynthesis protein HemY [Ochrobactrum sp. 715/2009]PJT29174.1 heme biosynthesis protein HemY [Ochrobactrum sp. 695/2009]PJT35091.1 heme biosynthesis protein HemY [Ochrobactrum sp. 689/2009]